MSSRSSSSGRLDEGNAPPHPHAQQTPPSRVDDWIVGPLIGSGSFGVVRLGTHFKTREPVAIKIVDKASIANVEDVERVYRETFILKTLKHANIIKLIAVIDTPASIMLVMEYAAGGDCFSYISALNPPRLGEHAACRLFAQMVAGVEYCHRQKIIHRDLKLENILLDAKKTTVHIADFGLSNSIKFGSAMATHCGTPSYTAPETLQAHGQNGIDSQNNAACDLWALGVILFAMLCGFLPFESSSVPALFRRIKQRQYKPPSWISAEARDLIDGLLTVDPSKRLTLGEVRSHPWMMMDYNPELIDRIAASKPVTKEMIDEARAESNNTQESRVNQSATNGLLGGPSANSPTPSPHAGDPGSPPFDVDQFLAAQVQSLLNTQSLQLPPTAPPPSSGRRDRAASFSIFSSAAKGVDRLANTGRASVTAAPPAPPSAFALLQPRRSLTALSALPSGPPLHPDSDLRLPRVSSASPHPGEAASQPSAPRLPSLKPSPLTSSINHVLNPEPVAELPVKVRRLSSVPPAGPPRSASLSIPHRRSIDISANTTAFPSPGTVPSPVAHAGPSSIPRVPAYMQSTSSSKQKNTLLVKSTVVLE